MTEDERSFLALVSLVKRGNKKGHFSKDEATSQKSKRDPKIDSKVIFRLHNHKEYDKIEIRYRTSWRNEAAAMMQHSSGDYKKAKMLFGSVGYIVAEIMDYLDPSVQEDLVYNLDRF